MEWKGLSRQVDEWIEETLCPNVVKKIAWSDTLSLFRIEESVNVGCSESLECPMSPIKLPHKSIQQPAATPARNKPRPRLIVPDNAWEEEDGSINIDALSGTTNKADQED